MHDLTGPVKSLHAVLAELAEEGALGTVDGRLEVRTRIRWDGCDIDWYAVWDGGEVEGYGLSPADAVDDLTRKLEARYGGRKG